MTYDLMKYQHLCTPDAPPMDIWVIDFSTQPPFNLLNEYLSYTTRVILFIWKVEGLSHGWSISLDIVNVKPLSQPPSLSASARSGMSL